MTFVYIVGVDRAILFYPFETFFFSLCLELRYLSLTFSYSTGDAIGIPKYTVVLGFGPAGIVGSSAPLDTYQS